MNMTSAKHSNHHVAGVKNAPKYSTQTRSEMLLRGCISHCFRADTNIKTSLLCPTSSFFLRDVLVKCIQTLPMCRRSAHNWF